MPSLLGTLSRRLRANPTRTLFTLLQLTLGSLALIVGLNLYLSEVRDRAGDIFGVNASVVESGPGRITYSFAVELFTQSSLDDLLELAPAVEAVALYTPGRYRPTVEAGGDLFVVSRISSVGNTFFELMGLELVRGTFFTGTEAGRGANVIVLSDSAAQVLFGSEDPIGQQVRTARSILDTITLTVIGTFRDPNPPVYQGVMFDTVAGLIPIGPGGQSGILARATPGLGQVAKEQLVSAADSLYGSRVSREDLHVTSPENRSLLQSRLDVNVVIFGLFGIVAVVLGLIGIFTQAMVEVGERTREIGMRRALGASRLRIGREFLAEATVMASVAGLAGLALAALVIPSLTGWAGVDLFSGLELSFRPVESLLALAGVVAFGGCLGFLPAWRAGRMRPIEALREG